MAHFRLHAILGAQKRPKIEVEFPSNKVSDFFGQKSFGIDKMKEKLPNEVFKRVIKAMEKGVGINVETADAVASAAKNWAVNFGVTHYTHWFQPLTGATAEKHDSFFDAGDRIEIFRGNNLVQQEPDASSFPSGGIRSTFEARGYTAWDPSSPMFILGTTLCIPTIFVSYTGEALDHKAPLLKAVEAIDKAATTTSKFFDRNVTKVSASLGVEQEYFVIDKGLFAARPDLVMAGRTVFGHNPARGQQLDDHYFGSIPSRVFDFMKEFEIEALKLGIPVSTRHNEVAPSQFEVAPRFEEINLATDHNQLLKDIMNKVAEKHNLKVLFHEKPFSGMNGNGKHCNWSLMTDTGVNLFQPSSSARENLQFLVFLINTLKGVHDHADLLRASIASAGNDFRLGANEAPPAIISAFIGGQLSSVLDELESKGNIGLEKGDNIYMKLGIDKIPEILIDNTDRNRTSPFAFTGNKFEFRAVGSDANVAQPMTALNLAVADQLNKFNEELQTKIDKGEDKRIAIVTILRKLIKESKSRRFEGDGYSENWVKEAEKKGLSNIKDTPRALEAYLSKATKDLFARHNVCNEKELEARHEIMVENYVRMIQIESRVMGDIALNHIIPTGIAYQNKLIENAKGLKDLGVDNSTVVKAIEEISGYINTLKVSVRAMIDERRSVNKIKDTKDLALAYCDQVKGQYFEKIRYAADKLELLVDDEDWPLVKYREMLFIR